MLSSVCRYLAQLTTMVVAACFIFAAAAGAQTNQNQAVNQFLANPAQVLQQYPNGGAQLISLIRDVAVAHPEALQTIIGLLSGANADQQMAIGSGLGQAAQIVVRTNQAYANQIQQAIAGSESENAKVAFAGATGNVQIGAAGGGFGGGGGGGGSGGPTGTFGFAFGGSNTGGGQTFGGLHYQNTPTNYFTGGGAGGATGGGTSGSVSPH